MTGAGKRFLSQKTFFRRKKLSWVCFKGSSFTCDFPDPTKLKKIFKVTFVIRMAVDNQKLDPDAALKSLTSQREYTMKIGQYFLAIQ